MLREAKIASLSAKTWSLFSEQTLADNMIHISQWLMLRALISLRTKGDPSKTDTFGRFCNNFHSLFKYSIGPMIKVL